MKLLFLATDAFGAPGGIAQYNRDLLAALSASGRFSEIRVLVRAGHIEQALPSGVTQLAPRKNKTFYALLSVRNCIGFRPDVIFCGHINLLPLCWVLSVISGVALWLQLHGIDAWQSPSSTIRQMTKRARLVTCVSRYTRRRFLGWSSLEPAKVRVLPNTVSNQFRPVDRAEARRHFGIEPDQHVLLTVGRLSSSEKYKGQDRVLRAMPALIRDFPTLCYLITGTGDDQQRLEALTTELNLTPHVRFMGQVAGDNLNALYNAADVYVMPSTGEGFGIVFLEAMAAGTPALGLDCDGSVDPLQDGTLGKVTDEENLVEAIKITLQHPRDASLPDKTQQYFGFDAFKAQVSRLLSTFALRHSTFN